MHARTIFGAVLVAALALPLIGRAEVLWRGDFETGDISQWSKAQQVSPERLQVVPSPVHEGRYALRAEVVQGDNPINASGNRNELVRMTNESEGDERYYAWSTLFPEDYPMTPTWQLFTQWHHSGPNGAPPVRFILGCSAADCGVGMPDTLFFIVTGSNVWTHTPVTKGLWHNFVLHAKWSSDPGVGFVELWYDGEQVVPKTFRATLFPGETNYLKQGLYRDAVTAPTQVVYHDGFVIGTALSDVAHNLKPAEAVGSTPPIAGGGDTSSGGGGDTSSGDGGEVAGDPTGSDGTVTPGSSQSVGCNVVSAAPLAGLPLLLGLSLLRRRRRA